MFSENARLDAIKYISTHFKKVGVALVGRDDELLYMLQKSGSAVYPVESQEVDERARFMVVIGGSEKVDFAKKSGLPYLVISKEVPLSCLQRIGVYDYQIIEYGYPNILILDTYQNEFPLQGSLTYLAVGVMVECLSIVGSGLRSERVERALESVKVLKKTLKESFSSLALLECVKDCLEGIGGAPFLAMGEYVLKERAGENLPHAFFYLSFSLLYLLILFTKIDFWVILPYMDVVRVRMLAEEKPPPTPPIVSKDLRYSLSLISPLLPSKVELMEYLTRFRLESGYKVVDSEEILISILLCGARAPKPNLIVELVENGYVDALVDL